MTKIRYGKLVIERLSRTSAVHQGHVNILGGRLDVQKISESFGRVTGTQNVLHENHQWLSDDDASDGGGFRSVPSRKDFTQR